MEVVFQLNEDVNQKKEDRGSEKQGERQKNSKRSPKITARQKVSGA